MGMARIRCMGGPDLWATRRVLAHCYLADWFVLYQLSKNCNVYFFRYLLRHMDRTLNSQCKSKHGRELFPSATVRSDSDIRLSSAGSFRDTSRSLAARSEEG